MRIVRSMLLVVPLAFLSPAAGQGSPKRDAKPDLDWATVKGRVVFAGEKVPEPRLIDVNRDKEACGAVVSEEWVVDPRTRGVQNVFVWIAPDTDKRGTPFPKDKIHPTLRETKDKDVVLDQPRCQFVPHCLGLRAGQNIVMSNSTAVARNVMWQGQQNQPVNRLVPPGKFFRIENVKAEVMPIAVSSSVHPWMKAWARVFDHPYFAVTDRGGEFEMKLAPVGKWRLLVWQESRGWSDRKRGSKGQVIEIKVGGLDLGEIRIALPPEAMP
jgi:hypothetical protein